MKKLVLLILMLALLASCCAMAEGYQAGDVIHGFELKKVQDFPFMNAELYYYQHIRTGAEVVYLANEDNNRTFQIAVRTPVVDNTGIAAVVKNAVMDGSQKYPSETLFYHLYTQTYNTSMEASADNGLTFFPVSSLSEEQLLKLADYYTDCCFHPLFMTDEHIFETEGWSYYLKSAEEPLKLNGTVFNNARNANKIYNAAQNNYFNLLYPGSTLGHDVSGNMEDVLELTWEDAKAYHAAYYHPSNSLTMLYGKLEHFEDFLALLDESFSDFERAEIVISDDGYVPRTEPVTAEFAYPVAASANTAKAAIIYYGFACEGVTEEEQHVLDLLTTLLLDSDSVLMQRLKQALPNGAFLCFVDSDAPDFEVSFAAANVERSDAELFQKTVNGVLAEIASQGLDSAFVSAVAAHEHVNAALNMETDHVGADVLMQYALYWQSDKDYLAYPKMIDTLDNFEMYNDEGLYAAVVAKYLMGNEQTALAITYPQPGGKEEREAALTEKLADIKAQMTEDEIAALVKSSAVTENDDAAAYLDQFLVVDAQNLPEEIREYDYSDEVAENGVRYIEVEADVDKVSRAEILLDLAGLPQEDIHWVHLYAGLVGNLPTTAHSAEELQKLKDRYLNEYLMELNVFGSSENYDAKLQLGFTGLVQELQPSYDLFYELLYDTQFTDAEKVAGLVKNFKDDLRKDINGNPVNYLAFQAYASVDEGNRYYQYATMLEYYDFLKQTEIQLQEAPEEVMAALRRAQAFVHNSANAVVTYIGSADSRTINRQAVDAFLSRLDNIPREKLNYSFLQSQKTTALIIEDTTQYNMLFGSLADMGLSERSGAWDVLTAVVQDWVLRPHLRDELGLYSIYHGMRDYGMLIVTNYDSHIQETYALLEKLPELMEDTVITQEMLDDYIRACYANYTARAGELSGAKAWIGAILDGEDSHVALQRMRELKQVTVEDVKQAVEAYRSVVENGMRCTAGSASRIYANTDYFGTVLNPFDLEDLSGNQFVDCGSDDPDYKIVRSLYEQGYMDPVEPGYFGMEETGTYGDLYTAFYVMIGGDKKQEEAIQFFIENGFLTEDSLPSDIMYREDMAVSLYNFARALGMPTSTASLDGYADANQVKPAIAGQVGWVLENGLMPSFANRGRYYVALEVEMCRAEIAEVFYDFLNMFM